MKTQRKILLACILNTLTSACLAFSAPTNSTLTLRLVNHSAETLNYTGITDTNIGNTFFVMPKVILPGGAATIVGITTPYTDLVGKMHFRDNKNYTHLLSITDPRMIDIKQPIFSIHNENLISFVKPSSFIKNKIQDPYSIAYSSVTIIVEENIKPDKDHGIG